MHLGSRFPASHIPNDLSHVLHPSLAQAMRAQYFSLVGFLGFTTWLESKFRLLMITKFGKSHCVFHNPFHTQNLRVSERYSSTSNGYGI